MGNTPSKNAPINTSVTAQSSSTSTALASAEDSDDPSGSNGGCSALPPTSHTRSSLTSINIPQNSITSTSLSTTPRSSIPTTANTPTTPPALKYPHVTRADNASLFSATSVSSSALSSISSIGTTSSASSSPVARVQVPSYATPSPASTSVSKPSRVSAVDVNDLIQRLISVGLSASNSKRLCLTNSEIIGVCRAARGIFLSQPTLLELGTPVKVVGDIHGQFGDLMRIFQLCGMPPTANYLFLGDYVDRGKQSIETFLLLLCFKIRYPENVFLLRGNHECASVTKVYGFYDECKRRASTKVWKSFVDVFNTLPIAATIGGKIFCVHGGLSPYLNALDDIRSIHRPTDIPDVGLLSDLLWSDPDNSLTDWGPNDRGVSYCFGPSVVSSFCS